MRRLYTEYMQNSYKVSINLLLLVAKYVLYSLYRPITEGRTDVKLIQLRMIKAFRILSSAATPPLFHIIFQKAKEVCIIIDTSLFKNFNIQTFCLSVR